MSLFFVDCEAPFGVGSPATGNMTEFGAVEYTSFQTFYGPDCSEETFAKFRDWINATTKGKATFISDNPAYDWQWINFYFHKYFQSNPFGFSARRIGDYYAGLVGRFDAASEWKSLRVTKHDHNPVNDAMGNAEAFKRFMNGERARERRRTHSIST